MVRFYHTLIICAVLVAPIGCSKKQAPAAPQKEAAATKQEPALGLMTVVPDNVLAFVATGGCDNLKPAFEKSILGRIWNDPEVQNLYQTATKQLLTLAKKQIPDANEAQVPEMVLNFAELAMAGPAILGAAYKQTDEGPPVYGFAIIDAGEHKAEIAARLSKLEGLARKGEIKEVEIGSFKMHGPADNRGGGVASRQDDLDAGRPLIEDGLNFRLREKLEIKGDVDLVEDDDVIPPGEHRLPAAGQGPPRPPDILILDLFGDVDESFPAELFDGDERSEFFHPGELAVLLAFEELADVGLQAVAGGAQGQPQGRRGLSRSISRIDLNISREFFRHRAIILT